MALVYVSSGTQSTGTGTSVTPALPASLAAGDLMMMQIDLGATASASINTPAGWTKINATDATILCQAIYWRIFQAGDSAPSVSWTGSKSFSGVISRFTGNDTSSPIGAVGTVNATSGSVHSSTALTTTRANSLVVLFDTGAGTTTLTTPAGWAQNYALTSNPSETCDGKAIASSGTSSGATSSAGFNGFYIQQQIELLSPAAAVAIPLEPLWDNRPKWRYQLPVFDQPQAWRNLGVLVPTVLPPQPWFDPPKRWVAPPGFEPVWFQNQGVLVPTFPPSVPFWDGAPKWRAPPGFELPPIPPFGTTVPTTKPSEPWFDPPKRWIAPPGFEPPPWRNLGIPVPTTLPPPAWFDPPIRWKAPPPFEVQAIPYLGIPVPTAAPQSEFWQAVKQPSRQTVWNADVFAPVAITFSSDAWWSPYRQTIKSQVWNTDVLQPFAAAVVQPSFVQTDWWYGARRTYSTLSWDGNVVPLAVIAPTVPQEWWTASKAPYRVQIWDSQTPQPFGTTVPTAKPSEPWFDPPKRWNRAQIWDSTPFPAPVPSTPTPDSWWQAAGKVQRQAVWNTDVLQPFAAAVVSVPLVQSDFWSTTRRFSAQAWDNQPLPPVPGPIYVLNLGNLSSTYWVAY